ncbi:MAG: hypothetical protein ACXQTR_00845, partial [Candidatus Methanospirareceae archaeon]
MEDDNGDEVTSKILFRGCCENNDLGSGCGYRADIDDDFKATLTFNAKRGGEKYKIILPGDITAWGCSGTAEANFRDDDKIIKFEGLEIRIPNNPPVAKGKAVNPIIDMSLAGIGREVILY